jgi:hypothetical protein
MLRYLVVGRAADAFEYGRVRGWHRLGLARYATPDRDDIRVVERAAEIFPVSGGIELIKGPGYEELGEERGLAFERLVETGGARWRDGDGK